MESMKPPKKNKKDGIHTIVKAALGLAPMGGPLSKLLNYFVLPSLDKRREKWFEDVATKLKEHEERIGKLEDLGKNEGFIDIYLRASRIAISTSEKEKLEALRNAVINVAINKSPKYLQQEIFLGFVNSFTVWHLKILALFQNQVKLNSLIKKGASPHVGELIKAEYPELEYQQEFYTFIWNDLNSKRLLSSGDPLGQTMSGMVVKATTQFGELFLEFIKEQK